MVKYPFIIDFYSEIDPMKNKLVFGIILMVIAGCSRSSSVSSPDPYGTLPTERQLEWQELERIGIIHFGLNTFINEEWGYGDADPKEFDPENFDPDQIVSVAKSAGIKGLILVAKHHDGFCLWPTSTTDYNISKSPWKDGEGDMVKAFEEACRKQDVEFGIYCSPWDRHDADYGDSTYLETYRDQLRELYSNYGDLFESWHDGANGGDGYYGGADETRKIDRSTYYDWDSTWQITRKLQPGAVIFSDAGWDVRWVGNENGYAADTTWETFTPKGLDGTEPAPGNVQYEASPHGTRDGKYWMPAESDFPLRPGWFYRTEEDDSVKSPKQLKDIYFHSVGRAGNMNIGLAPDKTGQMHKEDQKSLEKFGKKIKKIFSENRAENAKFKPSNIRGDDKRDFGVKNLTDDDRYSYWATDDSIHKPTLEVELSDPKAFNIIQLRENIKLGQRIKRIAIDQWKNDEWRQIATATGIGANRLIKLPEPIKTEKVRLRVTDSPVSVALSKFGLYLDNEK